MKTEVNLEELMDSLKGLQKASPKPFLATRVKATLIQKNRTLWEKIDFIFNKPVVAFTSIVLIIAINSIILFQRDSMPDTNNNNEEDLIANNYDLASDLNIINLDNEK